MVSKNDIVKRNGPLYIFLEAVDIAAGWVQMVILSIRATVPVNVLIGLCTLQDPLPIQAPRDV